MKVIESEKIICFDVDDTLVMHSGKEIDKIQIYDTTDGTYRKVVPHKFHINLLKRHYHRGFKIIVWSQDGYKWAESVVRHFELDPYITIVMTKPIKYVDDLDVGNWMGQHLYFKDFDNDNK